jgi:hypothetical protein
MTNPVASNTLYELEIPYHTFTKIGLLGETGDSRIGAEIILRGKSNFPTL